MRVLSYNQGAAGAGMMGAASLDDSLVVGLGSRPEVTLRFLSAPASSIPQKLLARPWPPLSRVDLDFHPARWHQVESLKARRAIEKTIRSGWQPDALLINSHSVSFQLRRVMAKTPTLLHVDTLVRPWAEMGSRRSRRHLSLTLFSSVRAEAHALQSSAGVLAWSSWAESQVREAAPSARVFQWHPGINTSRYRPARRLDEGRPKVLFIGGRFEQKGGQDLLTALSSMIGHEVDVHLVTPVHVPQRPGVFVHRLTSSDPALVHLIQQSSMLCLPTRGDASPWVILEAMACGVPVVGSDVGAIPEMLDFGASGIIIPAGSLRCLRAAVTQLLQDPRQARELAANGLRTVKARFDARTQGGRLADILNLAIRETKAVANCE